MYVIIVYDVKQKRVNKICKFLRQYLNWVQNSVFEGELSKSQFFEIKNFLKKLIKEKEDSVLIYKFMKEFYFNKEVIGIEKSNIERII